jgi:signal transduction histidine kinase
VAGDVVAAHGGRMTVASGGPGAGTAFGFVIPLR